ncbi:lanthionine synthetase C family protein [Catellatospora methionotrophica]|uniref:lanthionine synthetase C family protein n=1 Tax=Catellatospora methionotrophica TaxID=121620 RepID=UPI0033EA4D4A
MILTSRQRARAAEISRQLADQLTEPPLPDSDESPDSGRWHGQALSKGAIGVAVLHGVRARDGLGDPTRVLPWVRAATCAPLSVAAGSGLWFGAPAVAFALRTAAPGRFLPTMAKLDASIDDATALRLDAAEQRITDGRHPTANEFDLVRGLTGLGAYLLQRSPTHPLLTRLLKYLINLTAPLPSPHPGGANVPGWWTPSPLPGHPGPADGGHADLGAAHGIPGPLALLAIAMRHGVSLPGQAEAIDTISSWLEQWRQPAPAGPWWPEHITLPELRAGATLQATSRRPSWCYGTPGIARALQLAGIVLGDSERQQSAEAALARCLSDPGQLRQIVDPALCHGWSGVALTGLAAAQDSRTDQLPQSLTLAVDELLEHAPDPMPEKLPGLILGRAGIALTLHQIAHPRSEAAWQSCLLIN